jgi:uncharacterized protein YPO0396
MQHLMHEPDNSSEHDRSGFRLTRLEVYNWGTFHQQVYVMAPCGGTALLTGANASGKSTLVDALLTLLVPANRRIYNQASGKEKHQERDERTYIRGAWRKEKGDTTSQARTEYLRDSSSYSVLLAVFQNAHLQQDVTIAQVLRVGDEVERLFVVAPRILSITEHFRLAGTLTDLRKPLRASGAEVFNEFAAYHRHFRQLVNVRSDKAFDLFNQIVSIKAIGGLNAFVRDHMLEKTNARVRISKLRMNFDNLTRSHDAIQLATTQLGILEPLIKDADKYAEQQTRIREAQQCGGLVPYYIAMRKQQLLQVAITTAEQARTLQQGNLESVDEELTRLHRQQVDLETAIRNDAVERQIEQLKPQIEHCAEQQRHKHREADRYDTITQSLQLPAYQNEQTFYATLARVGPLLAQVSGELERLRQERDTCKQHHASAEEKQQGLESELASLRLRKSQIPALDVEMRNRLAAALHISPDELPFIGELVRVKETETRWEAAIERLLHGFGLQLLVPEQHYTQACSYIDRTHLGRRLVYRRAERELRTFRHEASPNHAMLYNKLEVKADTPLSAWLTAEITAAYDYVCCETLEQFQQERRALTVQGQIKYNFSLHEKDDSSRLGNRATYVLGWNNTEKIAALEKERVAVLQELSQLSEQIEGIEGQQQREERKKRQLERLGEFESFAAIDWRAEEARVRMLEGQVRELEQSSSLVTLRTQLAEANQRLDKAQQQHDDLYAAVFALGQRIQEYQQQCTTCEQKLRELEDRALLKPIEQEHGDEPFMLETIDEAALRLTNLYSRRAIGLQNGVNQLGHAMVGRMHELRRTSPKIAQEVDASLEAIEQYRRLYWQIKHDDLPHYAKKFKELLNDKVILDINSFKVALEQQEHEIEERVRMLNQSLARIDYSERTYIQLGCERTHDEDVRAFKRELRACLPDVSQQRTSEANEMSFQRIRALLLKFEQKEYEAWTNKVTNVNNWLDFAAEELYREDDKRKNHYTDSSGKSGGQKTKLAYTIMASAIAYQYGLDQERERERTFRFVVIDEAFALSDEANARYALRLFEQLHLQLLVVTPLEKNHVIEPFISACHYVVNNEEENDSRVYNLTIEQYSMQKHLIRAGESVHDYAL